jgi:hypothetical protein
MAAPLMRNQVVLAKKEATEGTDPTPTASADSLLVSNITVNPVGEDIPRDIITSSLSPLGTVVGIFYGEATFSTELRNIRTAITEGAPLRENPLYLMAGMSPQYAASSVIYRPKTDWGAVVNSGTLHFYRAGVLHVLTGAYANVACDATNGRFGVLNWSIKGVVAQITTPAAGTDGIRDVAVPSSPTYQAFNVKPPPVLSAGLAIGGFSSFKVQQLTWDLQNEVVQRDNFNRANGIEAFFISKRDPAGSFNPEQELRATHDFYGLWKSATEASLSFTVGNAAVAWDRVRFTGGACQYRTPKPGDRNGVNVFEVPFGLNRVTSAGDDEVEIAYLL